MMQPTEIWIWARGRMSDRTARFGDDEDHADDQTFFAGPASDERMTLVRASIEHVRGEWASFTSVPQGVFDLLDGTHPEKWGSDATRIAAVVSNSLSANPDWSDRLSAERRPVHFPLLRMYTEDAGYNTIFFKMNKQYRREYKNGKSADFFAATWLNELVNMELFAARFDFPRTQEPMAVYRGTVLPTTRLQRYLPFAAPDFGVKDRTISIPLGLHSCSMRESVAREFIERNSPKNNVNDYFAIIWEIKIVPLCREALSGYKQMFPDSVISTISANDLSRVSAFPDEGEVLLNTPFFEALHFKPIGRVGKLKTFRFAVVLVNANRAHISTLKLGDRDAAARNIFREIVTRQRYQQSRERARELDLELLANAYESVLAEMSRAAELSGAAPNLRG